MRPIFNILDPLHLRYLFQLRVGLSQLRYHKKSHNFADTPFAICLCNNGIEDTAHFLLYCSFFDNERIALTSTVDNILRKNNLDLIKSVGIYLYGHPSLSIMDNKNIILSTLAYIKCTNRFASQITIFSSSLIPFPSPYCIFNFLYSLFVCVLCIRILFSFLFYFSIFIVNVVNF